MGRGGLNTAFVSLSDATLRECSRHAQLMSAFGAKADIV
jgi:hypothetical protein